MATLARIQAGDLNGNECLAELYAEAVARGYWDNSEHCLHWFWSLAEKALRFERIKKTDSPGRLFHELIKRKEKRYSRVDEDLSQARLQSFEVHGLLDRCRKQSPAAAKTQPPKRKLAAPTGNTGSFNHDRATCLAHGLFQSLPPVNRKKNNTFIIQDFGEAKIEWIAAFKLGVDDLRVLQGLLALSGDGGLLLQPKADNQIGRQLRLNLFPKWDALEQDALVTKTSYRSLAKLIGYKSTNTKPLRDSIERLWLLSVIAEKNGRRRGFRLLAEYASDRTTGDIHVALNPMITEAVIGGQHVQLDMAEIRKLKTDCARLIHQRLCAYIDPGDHWTVSLDVLCSYAWPEPCGSAGLRSRRLRARKALDELGNLGWQVSEAQANVYQIKRPN